MKLFLNYTPVPASRPRVTKWGTFYSKKYNDYKNKIKHDIQKKFLNDNDYQKAEKTTALNIKIIFKFPFPKSYSKKKRLEIKENNYLHLIKPDLDNLEKAILDGMNEIVYNDDSQICELSSSKRYTEEENGSTEIIIEVIK